MATPKTKVLILTKSRLDYAGNTIGLSNSAQFLSEALTKIGVNSKVLRVTDGNSIDKEVYSFKPQLVILEALWVSPEKLTELTGKYPTTGFVVRIHSNLPFLSMEGTAVKQIKELSTIDGVTVAVNNKETAKEIREVFNLDTPYLPNLYLKPDYTPTRVKSPKDADNILDISCFGAIRPMKNQLIQALAAIHAAEKLGMRLHFHINSTRVEQKGDPILHNIQEAFKGTSHKLIEHGWEDHDTFLKTIAKMDVGLQVSFSESYNIVTADHVHVGVPVVVSDEISWLGEEVMANSTSLLSISNVIQDVIKNRERDIEQNRFNLDLFNNVGKEVWLKYLNQF